MCGIIGTVNLTINNNILDLLKNRGPDSSGLVQINVGHHRVALGHRRLAILDLSPAGHQPMFSADGNHAVVFNGEIYNHLELRNKIEYRDFRGHSDTETILYYLGQHSIHGIRDFNGIFAFCYIDLLLKKLYLVRDPYGVKPLYYSANNANLIFASEIKPIQNIVNDSIDIANLSELLRLRYLPSPDTLFRNIRKVRPGHFLEVDLSGHSLTIKEIPFINKPTTKLRIPFNEAVSHYKKLFDAAIQRQLLSDVEVGILLSGGIDSALVASCAQRYSSYRIKAFTVGFKDQDKSDEIEDAHDTASFIDLEHFTVRIDFNNFLDIFEKCTGIIEEPLATTSVIPMFYLSKLASQYVKVILSGQGADESLGGYGRYKGELLNEIIPSAVVNLLKPLIRKLGIRKDNIIRGINSLGEKRDLPRFLNTYAVFSDEEILHLTGHQDTKSSARIKYFYDLLQCQMRKTSVERMMSLDLRLNLSDDLLLYTDKITMHHSIECRVPMLDLQLTRFIESLPSHYRVNLLKTKIIHKQFAKTELPQKIINRRKKGFLSPTNKWLKNDAIRDILCDPNTNFANNFSPIYVSKVFDEHKNGFNRERHIFLLLGIYYWMKSYL